MSRQESRWQLVAPPAVGAPITPDAAQQAVIDQVRKPGHGPTLVLAGPGTGKTSTIVEAVAARVAAGTAIEQILVLTFSRKAAMELRAKLTARLATVVAEPVVWTFHAFSYRLLQQSWQAIAAAETDVDAGADTALGQPPRLLSGPEQDALLRDLLDGTALEWPPGVQPALGTRGFVDELRSFLARARSVGFDPEQLHAQSTGRHDWQAAAQFYAEYLDVLALSSQLDYAELVAQAVRFAASPVGRAELSGRWSFVVVDEYQDTDPEQVELLRALVGSGDLMVVGDPDQSIYAFRGADITNIVNFPDEFTHADATPATVLTLQTSRRCPPQVLAASRRIARLIPVPTMPLDIKDKHRALVSPPRRATSSDGVVEILVHPTESAELAHVADVLRNEHLRNGTPWSSMAVLVRSAKVSMTSLQRALTTAGVPVEVAGDEVPLADEPVLAPLLLALRLADTPQAVDASVARTLLLSPLGGLDPARVRQLGRLLRQHQRQAYLDAGQSTLASPSDALIARAIADPSTLRQLPRALSEPVEKLALMLNQARALVREGASAYAVLWHVWSATDWSSKLDRAALRGGSYAQQANRDLDAVVALFDAAARTDDRVAHRNVRGFLDELQAQQIPAETLAEQGVRADAVRLLTAHRSKGLEWDVVIVPGVQAEVWPDVRRRGSLLDVERLTPDGEGPPPSLRSALAEERRLFYVAITRARRRLVVSAVAGNDEDGVRPSPFLTELAGLPDDEDSLPINEVDPVATTRALNLFEVTAELRATLLDPTQSAQLHEHAATQLAALANAGVKAADPDQWWGTRPLTVGGAHVAQVVRLSGTSLQLLADCPLRWFLEHEAQAKAAQTVAMGFGSVIHALADEVADKQVLPSLDTLEQRLDLVWEHLGFVAKWESHRERAEARLALGRLLKWIATDRGRTLVATELAFDFPLTVESSRGPVELGIRGYVDRLEVDDHGRVWVVDFKTGRTKPSADKVASHAQLGIYQYAVQHGALGVVDDAAELGGAELVHLRKELAKAPGLPDVQAQAPLEADESGLTFIDHLLRDAVEVITSEQYVARPNDGCDRCGLRAACPAQPQGRQVIE